MIETFGFDQILFLLIIMAITATAAGFFAGFFGIGGGIITVPCLFYIFSSIGIDKSLIMHLSVGTSFAIIVPTAMMSVYTHYKHKAVDLNILKTYGIFVVIGVVIGAFSAALMDTKSLVLFFSLIIYLLALNLIFLKDKTKLKIKFNLIQRTIFGFVVGFISSLMGIGGAIMNVPILKFVGYTINKAIGTAASIGFLISIFGTIGFLTTGIIMQKYILKTYVTYVTCNMLFKCEQIHAAKTTCLQVERHLHVKKKVDHTLVRDLCTFDRQISPIL